MGRPRGSRNKDFVETRSAIAARLARRMQEPNGVGASFRDLAEAAGVTPPTLRHYFRDRAGALRAAHEWLHATGAPYLAIVRAVPDSPVEEALPSLLRFVVEGLRAGVARQLVAGLADGRREPEVGAACITECLEPILTAVEARLRHHVDRGELRPLDARAAALMLISPVVLAVLHQDELNGAAVRPLDVDQLIHEVSNGFLRGHATAPPLRTGLPTALRSQ